MWGLVLKEWKGVNKKTITTIILGIIIVILSVLVVGYGNYLHEKLKKEKVVTYVSNNTI